MEEKKTKIKKDLFRGARTLKSNSQNRGITLIALVITIVVLIILAAVAINLTLGNNGIFNRAKTAKEQYQNAEEDENDKIAKYGNEIDNYISGNRDYSPTSYSTEEQNTGMKWIDGKPIYQKTVNCGATTSRNFSVNHNISNIETVCNFWGVGNVGNRWDVLPYPTPDSITYQVRVDVLTTGTIRFSMGSGADLYSKVYVTIQYTKTTDTATN